MKKKNEKIEKKSRKEGKKKKADNLNDDVSICFSSNKAKKYLSFRGAKMVAKNTGTLSLGCKCGALGLLAVAPSPPGVLPLSRPVD